MVIQSRRLSVYTCYKFCLFQVLPFSSWYDRNKDSALKPSPNKGLGPSKSSSTNNDDLGDDDFDNFDPRGSAKSGKSILAGLDSWCNIVWLVVLNCPVEIELFSNYIILGWWVQMQWDLGSPHWVYGCSDLKVRLLLVRLV